LVRRIGAVGTRELTAQSVSTLAGVNCGDRLLGTA
jgi:hypothetical protein